MPTSAPAEDPADARSGIVAAATSLLREGGSRAVTTRAVAQAASVQPPTIFRLFGDKDGLLQAVAEHVIAEYAADKAALAAKEDGDPVEDLREAWRTHIGFGLANPDVFMLLIEPGRLRSSAALAAGTAVLRARVARVAAAGLLTVTQERAVGMIQATGTGAILALLSQTEKDRDPQLADALIETVLADIVTTAPAPPTSDPVAVAVTFQAVLPELPALSDAERGLLSEWLGRSVGELQNRRGG